jgi:hypothetical protein
MGSVLDRGVPDYHEMKDIENVVETFQHLVSRLSRDGSTLGELYVRAEKRAARYALLSETVVESVTSGILVVERGGEIALMNSSAKRLLDIPAGRNTIGLGLGDLLRDSDELKSLVNESLRTGRNSKRNLINVKTIHGRSKRLGGSISCLGSDTSSADAVIVVFAEVEGSDKGLQVLGRDDRAQIEHQGYLRGILDCYDMMSSILIDADGIRSMLEGGTLEDDDLAGFSCRLRSASELMLAFALSKGASGTLTELIDLNAVIESVLRRRNLSPGNALTKNLMSDLPRVKTVGKVLEMGLEMLVLGCMETACDGIRIMTNTWKRGGAELAGIVIEERNPITRPLDTHDSLREFIGSKDMRREAGLMLLRALPSDTHRIEVGEDNGLLRYSIGVHVPISNKTRPSAQARDTTDRDQDEE